jgi:hypothetical protein
MINGLPVSGDKKSRLQCLPEPTEQFALSVSQGSPPVNSPSLLHHCGYVDTSAGGATPCISLSFSQDEAINTPKCQKPMDVEIQTSQVSVLGRTRKNERVNATDTNEGSPRCLSTGSRHTCSLQEVDTAPGARLSNQSLFGRDNDIANRVFILATPAEIESDMLSFACASRQDLKSLEPPSMETTNVKASTRNRNGARACTGQFTVPLRGAVGAGFQVVSTRLGGVAEPARHSAFGFGETGDRTLDFVEESEASGSLGRIGSQRHPAASRNSRSFKLLPRRMKLPERYDDSYVGNSDCG